MTNTVRESLLSRMETLLDAVPGATFYRSRKSAVDRSEGQAIVLLPEEDVPERRTGTGRIALVFHKFTVLVLILVRGDPADKVADPILNSAYQAVMNDAALSALCALVQDHSTKWIMEEADVTACAVELRFLISYQCRAGDMSAIA